jgi:hypothetical protein
MNAILAPGPTRALNFVTFPVPVGGVVVGGGVTAGGAPSVMLFVPSSFATLPPGSPEPAKATSSVSPAPHGQGGGARLTEHEIPLEPVTVHVPTLLLVTVEIFSAGPAVSATEVITVVPVFATVSLY